MHIPIYCSLDEVVSNARAKSILNHNVLTGKDTERNIENPLKIFEKHSIISLSDKNITRLLETYHDFVKGEVKRPQGRRPTR